MEYDAITIDTNIFIRNSLNLDGGLLGQLTQFKDGPVKLLLSDIVVKEVKKHLIDKLKEVGNKLNVAVNNAVFLKFVPENDGKELLETARSSPSYEDIVDNRLERFISDTGAEIVQSDAIDINYLIETYFSSSPPFAHTGKKKNEFPDAIALLALENWAEKNQTKILAISNDKGWEEYASNSNWIDIEENLDSALFRFQVHGQAVSDFMAGVVSDLVRGNKPEMMEEIDRHVALVFASCNFDAKAESSYYYELVDIPELEYKGLSFCKLEDDYDIKVVHSENNLIVSKIGLSISVEATACFSFELSFSNDEYLDLGSYPFTIESEMDAEILVKLEGDFGNEDNNFDIKEIEVTQMPSFIDFGELEPDFKDWHSE